MDQCRATEQMFIYMSDGDIKSALTYCDAAEQELKQLEQKYEFQATGKQRIKEIKDDLIRDIRNGQRMGAKLKARRLGPSFKGIFKDAKIVTTERSRSDDHHIYQNKPEDYRQHQSKSEEYHQRRNNFVDDSQNENKVHDNGQVPGKKDSFRQQQRNSDEYERKRNEEECLQNQRRKYAAQALRQTNPNIADLSDVNRPTRVAERFSELHDNEWTEAFEEVTKSKYGLQEIQAVLLLLEIVEGAYKLCSGEAEWQIKQLEQAAQKIIGSGNVSSLGHGIEYLKGYRKVNAEVSISGLQQRFFTQVPGLCKKAGMKQPPTSGSLLSKYTIKAVELCWWLCVQDPPVYMVPTDGSKPFEKDAYRGYTRTGQQLDYYVWPALKSYREGDILSKGVAQFK